MNIFLDKNEKLLFKVYVNLNQLKYFFNMKCLLFFNYDLLNNNERILLKKYLSLYNLNMFLCKNNYVEKFLSKSNNLKFKTILYNNTLLVYLEDGSFINKTVLKQILNNNQLCLIGGYWDFIFYRAKLFKCLIKLKELDIKKKIIQTGLYNYYIILCVLSRIRLN